MEDSGDPEILVYFFVLFEVSFGKETPPKMKKNQVVAGANLKSLDCFIAFRERICVVNVMPMLCVALGDCLRVLVYIAINVIARVEVGAW